MKFEQYLAKEKKKLIPESHANIMPFVKKSKNLVKGDKTHEFPLHLKHFPKFRKVDESIDLSGFHVQVNSKHIFANECLIANMNAYYNYSFIQPIVMVFLFPERMRMNAYNPQMLRKILINCLDIKLCTTHTLRHILVHMCEFL
jgi:hypothetical protein